MHEKRQGRLFGLKLIGNWLPVSYWRDISHFRLTEHRLILTLCFDNYKDADSGNRFTKKVFELRKKAHGGGAVAGIGRGC